MSKTALILCGGKGTRFSTVSTQPKILANFRGEPFIKWLIDYIEDHGFLEVIFSLGYKSDSIIRYLERIPLRKISIKYIVETSPLGTGGAIKGYFENQKPDEVYIFNGDTFFSKKMPEKLFSESYSDQIVVVCKKFSINDRYGHFEVVNGKFSIKRGTTVNPIINSQVYCGVVRIPKLTDFKKLLPPFSTENLLLNQDLKLNILSYDGEMIDYGIPDAYDQLRTIYEI